jgi:WD40 repeat protein
MDDGRLFATARQRSSLGADLEIRSVASGALQAQVPIDDGWWISASPNGSALVTSSILGSYATTRRAGVWTAQRIGGEARTTNVTGAEEFGYSAPGEAVSVRRLPAARVVRRLPGTRGLEAAALTEDGELALLAGGTEIRLTNARTGRVRRVVSAPGPYSEVFFADQDRLLVVASVDDEVTVWERRTGRLLAAITSSGAHAEVSPDGTTLFTLSAAGTLAAWDLTGTRMFGQQYDVPADITAASFTDSGDVVVGTSTGEVTWLDGDDLTERSSVDAGARVVDLEPVAGTEMLAITPDHVIRIATHRQHLKVSGSIAVQGASDAAESSDGVLALAVDRGRGAMLIAPGGEVTTLALTAEKSLAGAVYAEQWGHVDWSPDGELLAAAANDGRVYLFGPTGHRLGVIQPHDTGLAPAVAFLDATTLLIGDRQGRVRPVNPRTQSPTGPPLDAASATPVRIAVARDLAVVGSMGSGVALLDTKAGVRYGNDLLAAGTEMLVPLLDDDLTLTVFAPEGVARRWPGDPQDWAARACATAGRALTQDEWQHHLAGRDYDPAC